MRLVVQLRLVSGVTIIVSLSVHWIDYLMDNCQLARVFRRLRLPVMDSSLDEDFKLISTETEQTT
jgi:hypothetical protein